jgi:8-oxo-dGTP diphosphatase
VAVSDGNGWVACACGSRHWGRFGAAGLLLIVGDSPQVDRGPLPDGATVLLQHRAEWSHEGGTWGLPGGARDSHEDIVTAALRETWEETGIDASSAALLGVQRTDHGSWSYATVIMRAARRGDPRRNRESRDVRWMPVADVADLPLHPGFARSWPLLAGPRVRLVVDIANVMGSRPDGWWRDRALAAQRLVDELVPLVGHLVTPDGALVTLVSAIVEGASSPVISTHPAVLVTAAPTADEHIAATVGRGDLVVTADAELRSTATSRGADVIGPRWLLGSIDEAAR